MSVQAFIVQNKQKCVTVLLEHLKISSVLAHFIVVLANIAFVLLHACSCV